MTHPLPTLPPLPAAPPPPGGESAPLPPAPAAPRVPGGSVAPLTRVFAGRRRQAQRHRAAAPVQVVESKASQQSRQLQMEALRQLLQQHGRQAIHANTGTAAQLPSQGPQVAAAQRAARGVPGGLTRRVSALAQSRAARKAAPVTYAGGMKVPDFDPDDMDAKPALKEDEERSAGAMIGKARGALP